MGLCGVCNGIVVVFNLMAMALRPDKRSVSGEGLAVDISFLLETLRLFAAMSAD